ncbi:hypothetical protein SAMN05216553_103398 [Lentzea fradiae]|uniref:Uncharacterized protein n=1 Tax=Lentzea fradiae TaxID=200378 RepID=A0A1G7P4G7_9PSEU|nr:hypothetical protein SAMN05216553_103398 [Lentzea fradiae]
MPGTGSVQTNTASHGGSVYANQGGSFTINQTPGTN